MAKAAGSGGRFNSKGYVAGSGIAAENRFRAWVSKQPKALSEVAAIIRTANSIPNTTDRQRFLSRERLGFDTRWTDRFSRR